MSTNKITAALASATNEVTLAAANLNFDFSLVKIPAPKEFSSIGSTLSDQRRDNAEHGSSHITARKLGALFEGVVPHAPNLIRSYGLRASDISRSRKVDIKATAKDGLFASHAGLDGTGIWAAATSGRDAIGVHLLACILARIWTPTEATAIWVQITADRKEEVEKTLDHDGVDYKTLAAARQALTRQQLAEWDASARAWLQEADKVHQRSQKQLLLIINNLSIAVNYKPQVYDSVIYAWRIAMQTMENLVQGIAQEIQDGAALLGLSAWHIYPDINVIGSVTKDISMNDLLVPDGGTITVGLDPKAGQASQGVHWSLSLAHLKYYGKPVKRVRSTVMDSSRLAFEQLWIVALGSLISQWKDHLYDQEDALLAIRLIKNMQTLIHGSVQLNQVKEDEPMLIMHRWLRPLANAAAFVLDSQGIEQDTAFRLVGLGRRLGAKFLLVDKLRCVPAAFGLLSTEVLLSVLSKEGVIELLRIYATKNGLNSDSGIIRYTQDANFYDVEDFDDIDNIRDIQMAELMKDGPAINSGRYIFEHFLPSPDAEADQRAEADRFQEAEVALDASVKTHRKQALSYASIGAISGTLGKRLLGGCTVVTSRTCRWIPRSRGQYIVSGMSLETLVEADLQQASPEQARDGQNPAEDFFYADEVSLWSENLDIISWRKGPRRHHAQRFRRTMGSVHGPALYLLEGLEINPMQDNSFDLRDLIRLSQDPRNFKSELAELFNDHHPENKHAQHVQMSESRPSATVPEAISISDRVQNQLFMPSLGDAPSESGDFRDSFEAHGPDFDAHQFKRNMESSDDEEELDLEPEGQPGSDQGELDDHPIEETAITSDRPSQPTVKGHSNWDDLNEKTDNVWGKLGTRNYSPLRILWCLSGVYDLLPQATIPCSVVERSLTSYKWAKSSYARLESLARSDALRKTLPYYHLTRAEAFAAIAALELGYEDVEISEEAMALTFGNSIFVAGILLSDPYEDPHEHQIKHIVGNIGRAGVALMVAPKKPQMKKAASRDWPLVKHSSFDGQRYDCFSQTTMHLSFTGFEIPASDRSFGARDVEIYYLETVCSVYDKGSWIGDLDVIGSLRHSDTIQRLDFQSCSHMMEIGDASTNPGGLICVDTWSELLNRPQAHAIARCDNNWLARLALTSMCIQHTCPVVLLPRKTPCWECIAAQTVKVRTRKGRDHDPWMMLRSSKNCLSCMDGHNAVQKKRSVNLEDLIFIW